MEEARTAADSTLGDVSIFTFPSCISQSSRRFIVMAQFFFIFVCFEHKSLCERLIMFVPPSLPPSSPRGHVSTEAPLQGEALHRRQGGGRRPGTLLFRASLSRPLAQVMGSGPTQVVGLRQRLWEG